MARCSNSFLLDNGLKTLKGFLVLSDLLGLFTSIGLSIWEHRTSGH